MSALLPAARLREPSRYPPPTRIADWPTDQPKPSYTGQGMNLDRTRLAKTPEHSLTVAPLVKTSPTRKFFPPQTLVPRRRPALHGGSSTWFLVLLTAFSLSKKGASILPASPLLISSIGLKPPLPSPRGAAAPATTSNRLAPSTPARSGAIIFSTTGGNPRT